MAVFLLEISKEATLDYLTDRYEGNWHGRDEQNVLEDEDNYSLTICNSNRYVSFTSRMENSSIS